MAMFESLSRLFKNRKAGDFNRFRVIFERFKQLLEGNNIALELISQLEDKQSGEFIFDINYLRQTTNKLSDEIYRVVYNLNLMSDNGYTELFDRVTEIQNRLEDIIDRRRSASEVKYVISYDDIDLNSSEIVGGKNAFLGEIRNSLKLPTPDGFSITTFAYRRFMEYNNLWPEIHKVYESSRKHPQDSEHRHDRAIQDLFAGASMPPDLDNEITKVLRDFVKRRNSRVGLAVRSSAFGEDEEGISFAGQFSSFMNCPTEQVIQAYGKVLASRFEYLTMAYNEELASDETKLPMAAAVQQMIPARAAGVVYTVDPTGEQIENLLITACFGLGIDVVMGMTNADRFLVSRLDPTRIEESYIGDKESMLVCEEGSGITSRPIDEQSRKRPCLTEDQVRELAEMALLLDRCFKRPLDIEWCLDENEKFFIIQCRPLTIRRKIGARPIDLEDIREHKPVIMRGKGHVAQRGIAAGKVKQIRDDDDPDAFPVGAIAVTKYTTPRLTAIIRRAAAIITDIGSSTGHMATVAREFGVPMIVNTGDATRLLAEGTAVTVDAEENIIYSGIVRELLEYEYEAEDVFRDLKEYRMLRQIIRMIAPLYLVDPKSPDFTPGNCRTYNDILRFCHEKAVRELVNLNMSTRSFRDVKTKSLKLDIPLDLFMIDLGDGLAVEPDVESVDSLDQIRSVPMIAILRGLTSPGVWNTQPVQLGLSDLISSLTKYSMTDRVAEYRGQNLAVLSYHYANISLRLGYHFNIIDTYVSENINDNYIYFRFMGGVTEAERRRLRAVLIKNILERLNFKTTINGDLVIGHLKQWDAEKTLAVLHDLGKLIGFTRQLDTQMQDEESVKRYQRDFFASRD